MIISIIGTLIAVFLNANCFMSKIKRFQTTELLSCNFSKQQNFGLSILDYRKFWTSKDKSGVGIIVDYSRGYTVLNGVYYFFQLFSHLICKTTYFNLLRSAK